MLFVRTCVNGLRCQKSMAPIFEALVHTQTHHPTFTVFSDEKHSECERARAQPISAILCGCPTRSCERTNWPHLARGRKAHAYCATPYLTQSRHRHDLNNCAPIVCGVSHSGRASHTTTRWQIRACLCVCKRHSKHNLVRCSRAQTRKQ